MAGMTSRLSFFVRGSPGAERRAAISNCSTAASSNWYVLRESRPRWYHAAALRWSRCSARNSVRRAVSNSFWAISTTARETSASARRAGGSDFSATTASKSATARLYSFFM